MFLLVIAGQLKCTNQEWLKDQMGTHNKSEMVAVQGSRCALTPQRSPYESTPQE
jgi:hypothetical protein